MAIKLGSAFILFPPDNISKLTLFPLHQTAPFILKSSLLFCCPSKTSYGKAMHPVSYSETPFLKNLKIYKTNLESVPVKICLGPIPVGSPSGYFCTVFKDSSRLDKTFPSASKRAATFSGPLASIRSTVPQTPRLYLTFPGLVKIGTATA